MNNYNIAVLLQQKSDPSNQSLNTCCFTVPNNVSLEAIKQAFASAFYNKVKEMRQTGANRADELLDGVMQAVCQELNGKAYRVQADLLTTQYF